MEVLHALIAFADFAVQYGLVKCIKTMLAALPILFVILLIRLCSRRNIAALNFYSMLLLFPAVYMGMSKVFFLPETVWVTGMIMNAVRPIHGKLYFGVALVLFLRFLYRNFCLRRSVTQMSRFGQGESLGTADSRESRFGQREWLAQAVGRVCAGDCLGLSKWYLGRTRIYVAKESISPFSGGICHPYIVLPEQMLKEWKEEQCITVLCHELLHIKSGHIIWTWLFSLLKIYWWINPLVYICEKVMQADMEIACDEKCMYYSKSSHAAYGNLLLAMIDLMKGIGKGGGQRQGAVSFLEKRAFYCLRRRIQFLSKNRQTENFLRQNRKITISFAAVFVLFFVLIGFTSYPKYTRCQEIILYDEKINLIDYDSEELRDAVYVRQGQLVIDEAMFKELLESRNLTGEYVYISYDTIMKVPGVGGFGNTGMVSISDYDDIFYLASDCTENRVMEFCLKYLI